eukprot:Trichotokara_eunicae@DN10896_c0_g1_i1.p1
MFLGGTLRPLDEFLPPPTHNLRLFKNKPILFEGPSVAPFENTKCFIINSFENRKFECKYESRDESVEKIIFLVQKICEVTPDGVVAFFPSFSYLNIFKNKLAEIEEKENKNGKKKKKKKKKSTLR